MKVKKPSIKAKLYKGTVVATGKHPVKLRIIFDRVVKYYSLGIYALPDRFNETVEPPVINGGKAKDNALIAAQLKKANRALETIEESGKEFSFMEFEKLYKQTSGSKVDVYGFIDSLVKDLEAEERYSTTNTYKDCKSSLEAYKAHLNGKKWPQPKAKDGKEPAYKPSLRINEIDLDFLNAYTRHLHKRLSPASVGIHLRTLRAVINTAITRRQFSKDAYPFKEFKGMPSSRGKSKKALTKERMKELYAYWRKLSKKDKYSQRWQSLSLFLFSYFAAGINMEDTLRLTEKNLLEGNLKFVRRKTKQEIEVPLHAVAAEIIADFSTISKGGFLFPYLEKDLPEKTIRHRKFNLLKDVNVDLKAIATDLGLSPFQFYSARHSFASVQHNQGTSTSEIGEYLGHTSESTTKNYLASIQTERKKEAFGKLI